MAEDDNNNNLKKKKSFKERSALRMRACGQFMWNREHRTCMGRTGLGWIQILGFYSCFYVSVAALWTVCMAVFLKTLDPEAPTQQHKYSMLKDNPGMGKWPMAFAADSTLIYFATTNSSTYDSYITSLSKVLNEYDKKSPGAPLKNCDAGTDKVNFSAACAFNISILGSSCTEKNNFGYSSGKPCVLLRINKIYDWQPASLLFNGKNITTNGTKEWEFSRIASNLKSEYIENDTNNYIPVSCQGENDGDIDNIKNITFYPKYGFSASYFPYENQVNYMPPAVMAEFDIEPGRAVMIWCKIWVANIKHDRGDLQGSVHFEMYITNKY